ncbi:MAG: hypothetical protein AB1Z98_14685 [Nannocystaceae bacterium]
MSNHPKSTPPKPHASSLGSRLGPTSLGAWNPETIAAALDARGPSPESLARTLLPLVGEIAGQELHAWGLRYGRRPSELRHDVAQDVMLALFENGGRILRTWDPARGLVLRGFVRRVVRFRVLQLFRSHRSNPWRNVPTPPDQVDVVDERASGLLDQLHVRAARDRLLARESPRGLRLYRALFIEQQSAEDTAAQHHMSRDAVYQWRARFKRRAVRSFRRGFRRIR